MWRNKSAFGVKARKLLPIIGGQKDFLKDSPVHHLWMRGYQGGIKTRSQSSLCLLGSWWLSNSLNQEPTMSQLAEGKYLSWTINIDKARSLTFDNICICAQSSNKRPSKNNRDVSSFLAKGSRGECLWSFKLQTACAANRTFTCMNIEQYDVKQQMIL